MAKIVCIKSSKADCFCEANQFNLLINIKNEIKLSESYLKMAHKKTKKKNENTIVIKHAGA